MKFITNKGAPDIPLEVLEAQEQGRLVFFCGAGVSYPAGLPIFSQLVDDVFDGLQEEANELESQAKKSYAYDRVLGLLEKRLQGNRDNDHNFVRREIIKQLSLDDNANLQTHKAILDLSKAENETHRLVTTNVDLGFQSAEPDVADYTDSAPKLPVPKEHKWRSVVHLHGIIDQDRDPDGEHLVFTSGDFGNAYLTERWASKFVTELFMNFTVLFIGYSIDDPVMRYITDAIAAEKRRGDKIFKRAYVFAESQPSKLQQARELWLSKGAEPILYSKGTQKHSNLHKSLVAWAEYIKLGLNNKKAFLQRESQITPISKDDNSEAVIRVLDILRERSDPNSQEITGSFANSFAQIKPVPPFGWFDVFNKYNLLGQVEPKNNLKVVFSKAGIENIQSPTKVTYCLWRWLIQHMNNKTFIEWVITSGSDFHPNFRELLRSELEDNKKVQLSPKAKLFWELQLSGLVGSKHRDYINSNVLIPPEGDLLVFNRFLERINPYLVFEKNYSSNLHNEIENHEVDFRIDVKINFSAHYFQQLEQKDTYPTMYVEYLNSCNDALIKAMNLWQYSSFRDDVYDRSHWDLSSIAKHSQNRRYNSWTILVELVRDLWESQFDLNAEQAKRYIDVWLTQPFPVFKRLLFHALTVRDVLPAEACLDLIMSDNHKWLWDSSVKLELTLLLKKIWPLVSSESASNFQQVILRSDVSDGECWRLLSKLKSYGNIINDDAMRKLREISEANPSWHLRGDESEDFTSWSTVSVGYESDLDIVQLESLLNENFDSAISLLIENETRFTNGRLDSLRSLSKEKPNLIIQFLEHVSKKKWYRSIWHSCLVGLSDAECVEWDRLAKLVIRLTKAQIIEVQWAIAFWVKSIIRTEELVDGKLHLFCQLLEKTLHSLSEIKIEIADDPIEAAINNSVGILTEALVIAISGQSLKAGESLPEGKLKDIATFIMRGEEGLVYGKFIFASKLHYFHAIDPDWTEKELLPHFFYEESEQARYMWQSYLWSPRISADLARLLKNELLVSLDRYEEFERVQRNLIQLFILVSIEFDALYNNKQIRAVLGKVGNKGLANASHFIFTQTAQFVESEADLYWKNRVERIISCWPKEHIYRDANVTENFICLLSHLDKTFIDATKLIGPLMTKVKDSHSINEAFFDSQLLEKYPEEVFNLLAKVIAFDMDYYHEIIRLESIIDRIVKAKPELEGRSNFVKLRDFIARKKPEI